MRYKNPFEVTKSVDFSDEEINTFWVDLTGESNFFKIIKPDSPVPMILLGGKGSGKTHVIRHFSYNTQRIRYEDVIQGIKNDGYIGVYFSLGGLNEGRFSGKNISHEKWIAVLNYYLDLCIAQRTISTFIDLIQDAKIIIETEKNICQKILELFDNNDSDVKVDFTSIYNFIKKLLQHVDYQVNNCVFTNELNINILVTRGKLVFKIPELFLKFIPELQKIKVSYFFDELENTTIEIQTYLQTLIREKKDPCSIKISGRLYSMKTNKTFCDNEENIEGSEYEKVELDSVLRENKEYTHFAKELCRKRLLNYDIDSSKSFQDYFETNPFFNSNNKNNLENLNLGLSFMLNKDEKRRKYFIKLSEKIIPFIDKNGIDRIIKNLECSKYPIIEKANIYLFYKNWKSGTLVEASKVVKTECNNYLLNKSSKLNSIIDHFKRDFYSQILYDYNQKQQYLGIDTFIKMSGGLPRNLLQILKHTYSYAIFFGEHPFTNKKISKKAQQKGVDKASNWFFEDANIIGHDKVIVKNSIERLSILFREIRFSDKPTECSVISFSVNMLELTPACKKIIDLACKWSLLIELKKGRRDKNSKRIDSSYQLNPMLSPHWDLPISVRGTIPLTPDFVNSIFDPQFSMNYNSNLKTRITTLMNVPFKNNTNFQKGLFDD